ncbi:hypothetical protein ABW20_dc0105988 [Dactylellina cionopaga]|nr:hypothetical protein ABW20_dc0105988 [Dactylellina cionopaga]
MTVDTPLSTAIAAQMMEISTSNNCEYNDPDFRFALHLLEEELQDLQDHERDARVPRTVRSTTDLDSLSDTSDSADDAERQAQIQADREFAEKLSRGEKVTVASPIHDANAGPKEPKTGKKQVKGRKVPSKHARLPRSALYPISPASSKTQKGPQKAKSPQKKQAKAVQSPKPTKTQEPKEISQGPPPQTPDQELSQLQDLLQILASSLGWRQDWQDDCPTTSARAATKRYQEESPVVCSICGDMQQSYRVFTLNCEHRYCIECLRDHIMHALNQPGSELPRCCEPLPLNFAAEVLMEAELNKLMDRRDAQESSKQVTCAHCKADILQGSIKDSSAYCVACSEFTCTHCGKDLHDGICAEDHDTAMLLETARREGWSKCDRCNHLVELTMGCFHMTCRCGYNFCYLCSQEWKTCECPSSSEHSVFGRLKEATGKGAELLRRRWASPKAYVLDKQQLNEFKQQAMDKHRNKMNLRQSLHKVREERQWDRQVAEQVILLRTEIMELQGQVDHAEENRKRKTKKEVEQETALKQKIVAKSLKVAEKKGKPPSKKGKERAIDVEEPDNGEIVSMIMGYVKE